MTTSTDIGNRALQLLGTRTNIASLTESSNEAGQLNIAYAPITNWCFGVANWNFARNTVVLQYYKGPSPALPPPPWSSTYPPPPWTWEYYLPTDFVRAIYLTNNTAGAAEGYAGEPRRFALGYDSAIQQEVLFTNETPANLIYTSNAPPPSIWPWYFERLAVIALAQTTCMSITGSEKLSMELSGMLEQQINLAVQANTAEGLMIPDATPEWIQASGIEYPYRRLDQRYAASQPQPQQGNRPGR